MRWASAVILAAFLAVPAPAGAHEAPSGWSYPWACCANLHCHPVPCESLDERPGGVIVWRGLTFDGSMVKVTGDKDCHVCHEWEEHMGVQKPVRPHCVFVRPMS